MTRTSMARRLIAGGVAGLATAAALAGPLDAGAAGTVFLGTPTTPANTPMTCANVAASTTVEGNVTTWDCAGTTSTNAVTGGSSAGDVVITATSPAGATNCAGSTTFSFTYADPFGIVQWSGTVPYVQAGITCQTNYAGLTTAIAVHATGINAYPFLAELCQFSTTGPLGGAVGFGEVGMSFYIDSGTGCTPRNS